jgi:hypothetical protein
MVCAGPRAIPRHGPPPAWKCGRPDRGWGDRDQVIDEEGVQDRPERLGIAHSPASAHAGSANASNRRFAWFSSPGVMVR